MAYNQRAINTLGTVFSYQLDPTWKTYTLSTDLQTLLFRHKVLVD